MYDDIDSKLSSLKEPTAFTMLDFDYLLDVNVKLAQICFDGDIEYIKSIPYIIGTVEYDNYINNYIFKNAKWQPLESDPYMKNLRVLTLRQIHTQADKKETVKQILVTTATGSDLDDLGSGENVFRDDGEYPYAEFEFKLLVAKDETVYIPKGLILSDDTKQYKAIVLETASLLPGTMISIVKVLLQEYVEESEVKTETLVTSLQFAVEIKQLDIFKNGATNESDDRYRVRIIASNDRYSTAGSVEAYKFHALSADSRIDDITVLSEKVLEVNIYIASFTGVDTLMIDRVYEAFSARYVRPLNDRVIVKQAEIIIEEITVTVELFDILSQSDIDTQIRSNFSNSFFIGQDFVRSDLIRKCHINGVYRVTTDFSDVIISEKQIFKISSLNINFKEAIL
jgi:phage-related baseplate assembly protein